MDFPGGRLSRPRASCDEAPKTSIEARASRLHAENRRRAELFNRPVMADNAMNIMLTALIAHEQGTRLTRTAAAMANRLERKDAEPVMADLVAGRLVEKGDGTDLVRLTPLGVDLMREFVSGKHRNVG